MAEWSIAPVLKTGDGKPSVSSNLTASAKYIKNIRWMITPKNGLGFALVLAALASAHADSLVSNYLRTQDAQELGLTLSSYSYQEPSVSVGMTAINYGLEYQKTSLLSGGQFLLAGIDYAAGTDRYSGSGTLNVPKYYYNARLAIGTDWVYGSQILSPYIGFGYRFLNQTGGGLTTSTGAVMYDRQSTYLYIPVGFKQRALTGDGGMLESSFELDYLLAGNQFSGLSVMNNFGYTGSNDITNRQTSGYGLNASFMYRRPDGWSLGPYWKYWNIASSDLATWTYKSGSTSYTKSMYERANTTEEFGFKALYQF